MEAWVLWAHHSSLLSVVWCWTKATHCHSEQQKQWQTNRKRQKKTSIVTHYSWHDKLSLRRRQRAGGGCDVALLIRDSLMAEQRDDREEEQWGEDWSVAWHAYILSYSNDQKGLIRRTDEYKYSTKTVLPLYNFWSDYAFWATYQTPNPFSSISF